jgi:hypothetical protein
MSQENKTKAKQKQHFTIITEEEALSLLPSGDLRLMQVGNTEDHLETNCVDDQVFWYQHIRPLFIAMENKIIEKLKNKKQQLYSQPVVTNIEIGNGYYTLVNPDTMEKK